MILPFVGDTYPFLPLASWTVTELHPYGEGLLS